jgi:hypothetical protein
MMRARALWLLAIAVPVIAAVVTGGIAMAGGQDQLAGVRNATAPYHDLDAAKAAGYTVELPDVFGNTCIANLGNASAGAMGVHMVDLERVGNPSLDPSDPEVMVYERRNNGSLKLVAVEWVVFKSDVSERPRLFGVAFDSNDGSRYGLDPFWALHAWIWKPNPTPLTGIFSQWNPRVSC